MCASRLGFRLRRLPAIGDWSKQPRIAEELNPLARRRDRLRRGRR